MPGPPAGQNWRKLAPVTILAVLNDYMEKPEQQVVVLFQVLAAELNFGYRFQCVRSPSSMYCKLLSMCTSCLPLFCTFQHQGCLLKLMRGVMPANTSHHQASTRPALAGS